MSWFYQPLLPGAAQQLATGESNPYSRTIEFAATATDSIGCTLITNNSVSAAQATVTATDAVTATRRTTATVSAAQATVTCSDTNCYAESITHAAPGSGLSFETPVTNTSTGTTLQLTVTTTGTNRLVLIVCPHATGGTDADIASVSGSYLGAYTRVANTTLNAANGSCSIWAHLAPDQLTGGTTDTVTITYDNAYNTQRAVALAVYGHKDTATLANNFGTPVAITDRNNSTAAAITVTATAAGSTIVGALMDWNSVASRTLRGDTTRLTADHDDTAGDLYMFYRSTSATAGSGDVTIGTSAPTDARFWATAIEVLSAPATGVINENVNGAQNTVTATDSYACSYPTGVLSESISGAQNTVTATDAYAASWNTHPPIEEGMAGESESNTRPEVSMDARKYPGDVWNESLREIVDTNDEVDRDFPEFKITETKTEIFTLGGEVEFSAATNDVVDSTLLPAGGGAVSTDNSVSAAQFTVTATDAVAVSGVLPNVVGDGAPLAATDSVASVAITSNSVLAETVTATDSVALARRASNSVPAESVTATDAVEFNRLGASVVTPAETVTPTDAVVVAGILPVSVPEEKVSATDSVAITLLGSGVENSSGLTVTDSVDAKILGASVVTPAEIVTATDSVGSTAIVPGAGSAHSVIASNEVLDIAGILPVSVPAEQVTPDSSFAGELLGKVVSESVTAAQFTVTPTDAVDAARIGKDSVPAEQIAATDAQASAARITGDLSDTVTATDTNAAGKKTNNSFFDESPTLVDTQGSQVQAASMRMPVSLSETVTATDSVDATLRITASLSETSTPDSTVEPTEILSAPVTQDSTTPQDSVAVKMLSAGALAETVTATDTVDAARLGKDSVPAESVTATDSVACNASIQGLVTETLTSQTDQYAHKSSLSSGVQESVTPDTSFGSTQIQVASLSESVTQTDLYEVSGLGVFAAYYDEHAGLASDSLISTLAGKEFFSDITTTNFITEVGLLAARTLTETATATDAFAATVKAPASVSETVTATDSVQGAAIRQGAFSDTVTATDSLAATGVGAGSLAESTQATDIVTHHVSGADTISESTAAQDDYEVSGVTVPVEGQLSETATPDDVLDASQIHSAEMEWPGEWVLCAQPQDEIQDSEVLSPPADESVLEEATPGDAVDACVSSANELSESTQPRDAVATPGDGVVIDESLVETANPYDSQGTDPWVPVVVPPTVVTGAFSEYLIPFDGVNASLLHPVPVTPPFVIPDPDITFRVIVITDEVYEVLVPEPLVVQYRVCVQTCESHDVTVPDRTIHRVVVPSES